MIELKTLTQIKMAILNLLSVSPAAILNYIRYKCSVRRSEMDLSVFGPILGALLVTRRCNLNCSFCIVPPSSEPKEWQDYEADPAKVIRIMDHPAMKRALYVGLSGGEPLLNGDLPEIIRLIRRRGHLCGIVTNGILLDQRVGELKKSGLNIINVSLYDANTRRLAAVLPKINRVFRCRANKILRRSELENEPWKIEEAIRVSRDAGCYGLYFGNYLPHGVDDSREVIFEDNPRYLQFWTEMTLKYRGFPIYWPTPMKRILKPEDKKCRMLWHYLSVDMMGNMGLCCNHSTDRTGAYGNLFVGEPAEGLNHSSKIGMRKVLLEKDGNVPAICRNCPIMCDRWVSDY